MTTTFYIIARTINFHKDEATFPFKTKYRWFVATEGDIRVSKDYRSYGRALRQVKKLKRKSKR